MGDGRRRTADVGVPEADRRQRPAGNRRDRLMVQRLPVPAAAAPAGRRATARAGASAATSRAGVLFGGIGLVVLRALFQGSFWLTGQLDGLRGARRLPAAHRPVVAVPDLPLVPRVQRRRHRAVDVLSLRRSAAAARGAGRDAAPVSRALLAHRRAGVVDGRDLSGAGAGRRRPRAMRGAGRSTSTAVLTVVPFAVIPVAAGTAVTLLLVNTFPGAPRARHPDADGAAVRGEPRDPAALHPARAAAAGRVAARSHRLLRDAAVADHAAAAVVLGRRDAVRQPARRPRSAARRRRCGRRRWRRWSCVGAASERWHFTGFSRSQEAPKARFTQFRALDVVAGALPLSPVRRQLLIKDLKIFLRDVSQWSQLLLLLALVLVYLYNFRVLDLERIPYMSGFLKNVYAFLESRDGRVRDGDRGGAVRVSGGVGRRRGVLDHPDVADLAARFPVVEVLDRPRAGAGADRGADDRGERVARRRSVPEGDGRRWRSSS